MLNPFKDGLIPFASLRQGRPSKRGFYRWWEPAQREPGWPITYHGQAHTFEPDKRYQDR